MKIDPVHYYYKDLESGTEMNFSKLCDWGWTVGFPKSRTIEEHINYKGHIPWPELSEEEQKRVDENYANLKRRLEESD